MSYCPIHECFVCALCQLNTQDWLHVFYQIIWVLFIKSIHIIGKLSCRWSPWGSVNIILTEILSLVSLEKFHYKPICIYFGGAFKYQLFAEYCTHNAFLFFYDMFHMGLLNLPINIAMTSILSEPQIRWLFPSCPSTMIVGAPNAWRNNTKSSTCQNIRI